MNSTQSDHTGADILRAMREVVDSAWMDDLSQLLGDAPAEAEAKLALLLWSLADHCDMTRIMKMVEILRETDIVSVASNQQVAA